MSGRPFDVTYDSADLEVAAAGVLWPGFPAADVRLRLDGHAPALIMVCSALAYYGLVRAVFPRFRPADAAETAALQARRSAHNVALFLFSLLSCSSAATFMWTNGQLFTDGAWVRAHCEPVEGTWLRPLSIAFVLSKLWEWGDTLFLVALGTRPPQFLHLYHHATTFWLFCLVVNMPGPEKFGLLLNGGVHTLMYWHYWRPWPKAFVPAITALQIAQLAFVTYSWAITPETCPDSPLASSREEYPLAFNTPYLMVPVYTLFFVRFFVNRFVLGKGRAKKE